VEIPKPDGGVRKLGIPTVLDRFIQQAVMQVLQRRWDRTFSDYSYGFRPGRSAHQAVAQAQQFIAEGHGWCVDLDLEKFFDRVNHDKLMGQIAKRVEDNLGYLRRQGRLLGNLPAGYTRGASKGSVAINEAIAPTIRRVFELYASGDYSFRRLALTLNEQGVVTPQNANGLTPARLWSSDVIKEILARPTYAGILPTPRNAGDDWRAIVGTHPAIISPELWERCQGQRMRNRPGIGASIGHRTARYPLTPILRCGECGSSMRGFQSQWRDRKIHYYYACSARRRYTSR